MFYYYLKLNVRVLLLSNASGPPLAVIEPSARIQSIRDERLVTTLPPCHLVAFPFTYHWRHHSLAACSAHAHSFMFLLYPSYVVAGSVAASGRYCCCTQRHLVCVRFHHLGLSLLCVILGATDVCVCVCACLHLYLFSVCRIRNDDDEQMSELMFAARVLAADESRD